MACLSMAWATACRALELVERRRGRVETDVAHVERLALHELQVGIAANVLELCRLDEVHAVNVAGLQRLQPSGRVGDRPEDQLVEQRRLAPVVLVALQGDVVARNPFDERERPRSDRSAPSRTCR